MFCSNCGKKITEYANFCRYCGHKQEQLNTHKPPTDTSIPNENEYEKETEYAHMDSQNRAGNFTIYDFVGPNSSYYERKWRNMKENGISWNFAAFFLSYFWLSYRKMYKVVFYIAFVLLVFDVFVLVAGNNGFILFLDTFIGLIIAIFVGMMGNNLYKKHAERQLTLMEEMDLDEAGKRNFLLKKGGRSWLGVLMGFLIFLGVYVIPSVIIYDYAGYPYASNSVEEQVEIADDTAEDLFIELDASYETFAERVATASIDVPFEEATYEQKVLKLIHYYDERIEDFEARIAEVSMDTSLLHDPVWLDEVTGDLDYLSGMVDSIFDIEEVPLEYEQSHAYLIEFADAFSKMTRLYWQAIESGDEAIFVEMLEKYDLADEILYEYGIYFERELQVTYE